MYGTNSSNNNAVLCGSDMLLGLADMAMGGSRWLLAQAQDGMGAMSGVLAQTQEQVRHSLDGLRYGDRQRLAADCERERHRQRREEAEAYWAWSR